MTDFADKALLPAGMCDVLPPDAEFEARATDRLMSCFAGHGYERVKPPLIAFEESLLAGNAAAMAEHTFRLMDPVSQRLMGPRADMTLQVARIATTRLGKAPRPLRLSYAGQVLRVRGSQLGPGRRIGQVGAELIGASEPAADAEVIAMAVEALDALAVPDLSVELGMPTLVPAICAALDLDEGTRRRLRAALDREDAAEVAALGDRLGADGGRTLSTLLAAAGPAAATLAALDRLALPGDAAGARDSLRAVVEGVRRNAPDLTLTIDPVEVRGFEYHTGVTFTVFARGVRGELGRGGRYVAGGEAATGLTLSMDTVLRALPGPPAPAWRRLDHGGRPGGLRRPGGRGPTPAMPACADGRRPAGPAELETGVHQPWRT